MKQIDLCPICHNSGLEAKLSTIDFTHSKERFKIKICLNCDLLLTTPRPNDSELSKYYQSDDYISHSNKPNTFINLLYILARRYTLQWKYKLISKYSPGKKLLDVGCGTGELIKYCYDKGMDVHGVEPAETAVAQANSKFNDTKVYRDIDEYQSQPDIITLWHVLEHLSEPTKQVELFKELLGKNGILLIAIPNPNAWDSKHYGEFWAGYDTPRHLWHFSQNSMMKLLQKANLKLIKTVPLKLDAFYISLLSEKYKNHGKMSLNGMINAFVNGLRSNYNARKTGEYSSLIYIIKKSE